MDQLPRNQYIGFFILQKDYYYRHYETDTVYEFKTIPKEYKYNTEACFNGLVDPIIKDSDIVFMVKDIDAYNNWDPYYAENIELEYDKPYVISGTSYDNIGEFNYNNFYGSPNKNFNQLAYGCGRFTDGACGFSISRDTPEELLTDLYYYLMTD